MTCDRGVEIKLMKCNSYHVQLAQLLLCNLEEN